MKALSLLVAMLVGGCSASSATAPITQESGVASAVHPAVIELYQSQGCSSCPPALAVLDKLAKRPDILALNFAVTYWDQLGWKDQFAQPAFTARQWDYAHAQRRGNVQTPQLIVNGRSAVLGSRENDVLAAIAANARGVEPAIGITGSQLTIGAGKPARATVWLVDYDPRRIAVPIRAGENGGRTLVHTDIVKRLEAVGSWSGKALSVSLPGKTAGLSRAVLIQNGKGGPILAARRL